MEDTWTLNRIVILFTSCAFLLIGIQVGLFHYRQNFHHKSMWVPVILAPILFLTGLALVFIPHNWPSLAFAGASWAGVAAGLTGFYLHFRGVGIRVGGWTLRNFLIGPPVVLPLMFAALSILGLVALYWEG